jgi:KDO2-lipid IV(A) lauroyltransferase
MYYIIYGILYLLSLLPLFILYRISDLAFFIIYYISGYRKPVVMKNLDIAFPEKSTKEKKAIAKQFYKNLIDTFIETIKLLSISKTQFSKRAKMDLGECNALAAQGKNLVFCTGHQMNWEYGNRLMSENINIPWVGVYMKIKNGAVEKLFYKLRTRQGAILVAAQEFGTHSHNVLKPPYSLGLVADQNPGAPGSSYWLNFFNKPAPFIMGPGRWAVRNNTAVVFVKLVKIKRGYYEFVPEVITENAKEFTPAEQTILYRNFLESSIRKQPDNYLWSHNRWKWDYEVAYKKRWIDITPPPFE